MFSIADNDGIMNTIEPLEETSVALTDEPAIYAPTNSSTSHMTLESASSADPSAVIFNLNPSDNAPHSSSSSATPNSASNLDPMMKSGVADIAGPVNNNQIVVNLPPDPFVVITNNAPGFKYKYPQAKPTPPGEDDVVWNKVYTAADSRMYNHHGKNAKNSEKFRLTGETRTLALKVLAENKIKHQKKIAALLSGAGSFSKALAVPASAVKMPPKSVKKEPASDSRDSTPTADSVLLSISEKIKGESGRNRKATSVAVASSHGTPVPTSASTKASPAPQFKDDKENIPKKASITSKRPGPKPSSKWSSKKLKPGEKAAPRSASQTPAPKAIGPSDSESNDGLEYCICRGPDDHRMMINCEGPCKDWYHCSCVEVDVEDAKELLDRYVCPKCTTDEIFTTWKPMCRCFKVNGCRNAARVAQQPQPSKYCSDEHAKAFWIFVASLTRKDDVPSKGGALSTSEISVLAAHNKTAADWHALGKKPKLARREGADSTLPVGLDYVTPEEAQEIEKIHTKKKVLQGQIEVCQAQKQLLAMIHERSKIAAKQPNLDNKDICGYDNRLAMNELQFLHWKNSEEGKTAFLTNVLSRRTAETAHMGAPIPYPGQVVPEPVQFPDELQNICLKARKKCRHFGWRDIHGQDYQATINNIMAELRKLQAIEDEIIEDSETREASKDYDAHNQTIQHF